MNKCRFPDVKTRLLDCTDARHKWCGVKAVCGACFGSVSDRECCLANADNLATTPNTTMKDEICYICQDKFDCYTKSFDE
jgi:hypothetical protein